MLGAAPRCKIWAGVSRAHRSCLISANFLQILPPLVEVLPFDFLMHRFVVLLLIFILIYYLFLLLFHNCFNFYSYFSHSVCHVIFLCFTNNDALTFADF